METLFDTNLSLPLIQKGKVRDIYDIDEKRMLIVTTDRLSAFDVVFDQPISKKGAVLTSVANFWFEKTKHIIPNHLTHEPLNSILSENEAQQVKGRAIIVKKLKPLAVEAIVRGYIIGSGWKDYQKTGQSRILAIIHHQLNEMEGEWGKDKFLNVLGYGVFWTTYCKMYWDSEFSSL